MLDLFLTAGTTPPPATEETPVWLVCVLGIVVVFIGLIAIIGLVELMTFICNKISNAVAEKEEKAAPAPVATTPAPTPVGAIENRGELVAAICAAVAEEEGTDISAIRVVSLKKL
ncbi:MAG: OadG family protein [Clostridia bacterium]|nr:OadG family protein [Clostridia bacterium]